MPKKRESGWAQAGKVREIQAVMPLQYVVGVDTAEDVGEVWGPERQEAKKQIYGGFTRLLLQSIRNYANSVGVTNQAGGEFWIEIGGFLGKSLACSRDFLDHGRADGGQKKSHVEFPTVYAFINIGSLMPKIDLIGVRLGVHTYQVRQKNVMEETDREFPPGVGLRGKALTKAVYVARIKEKKATAR